MVAVDVLQQCIQIVIVVAVVLGAFAVGRTIYVFVKEPIARNVDCCVHLPLFFWAILQNVIVIIVLIAVPELSKGEDDVCSLFDGSQRELGGIFQFLNVFLRAAFIPCVLITIYIPYLVLTRAESMGGISHLDILKSAGVVTVYSTIVGTTSIIIHNEVGSHKWADKYCFFQPYLIMGLNILSFLVAFTFGPYFWFHGLKEYFKMSKLTDDERRVAFGEVMDTLRKIRQKENQINTEHEIEMAGVPPTSDSSDSMLSPPVRPLTSDSDLMLSPPVVGSFSPLPSAGSPEVLEVSEPAKRTKYVSDIIEVRAPGAHLTKPPLHRIITADSPGHAKLRKASKASRRKSLLSRKDLKKRKRFQSKRRMHSIFVLREKVLDNKDIQTVAKEHDLEIITPQIIHVVNSLNKKLIRCGAFLGFVLVASFISTILELTETLSTTMLQLSQMVWYFAPLLICNIVFEAPSFKNAGIRLIPYNDNLRECICKRCFSPFRNSTVEITIVPSQQSV